MIFLGSVFGHKVRLVSWFGNVHQHARPLAGCGCGSQGAGFNGKKLQHLSADAASAVMVPDVMFLWAPKSKPMPYPNCLATPLYRSQDRSKVLFEVQVGLRLMY